jgi:hypothetical protein
LVGLRLVASLTEFCTPVEVIRGQVRVPVKLARVALASLINQVPVISWLASQLPFSNKIQWRVISSTENRFGDVQTSNVKLI